MMVQSLLCLVAMASPDTLTVSRGVNLGGVKWWGIRDTFVSQANPETNFGRDWLLEGGSDKTIVVNVDGLETVVPPNMEIAEAELVFTREFGDASGAKVRALSQPWIEGGGRRGLSTLGYVRPGPARRELGATWKTPAQGGSGAWPEGGGFVSNGPQVGTATVANNEWVLSGLGEWARSAAANPLKGSLAIRFPQPVIFTSSDAPVGRPQLKLTLRPISRTGARVTILGFTKTDAGLQVVLRNTGSTKSSALEIHSSTSWRTPELKAIPALDPSQTTSVAISQASGSEAILASTRVVVTGQGVDLNHSQATYHASGLSIPVDAATCSVVERWNQVVLPQSRTSFAPDGPLVRLNAMFTEGASPASNASIRSVLKLPTWFMVAIPDYPYKGTQGPADAFPGMGGGDARDETSYMPLLPLTADGRLDKTMREGGVEWTGLLSITDIALLESQSSWAQLVPDSIAIRVFDSAGAVVRNTPATLYAQDQKSEVKLSAEGTARISRDWLANPLSLVRIEVEGESGGQGVLKGWQTVDAAVRTAQRGVLIPVILFGKAAAVDFSRDLAADREWMSPGEKVFTMGQSIPAGSAIEIDLGRDRMTAMVEIVTDPRTSISGLTLVGRQTGQISGGENPFYRSDSYEYTSRSFGVVSEDRLTLRLQAKPQSIRYLRIEPAGGALPVFQVRIFPPLAQ
jgi:hypothetical protein